MAIQLDLSTSQFGVPFTGAYFRIVTAAVSRQRSNVEHKHTVMIDVVGYASPPENDDTRDVDFRRYHAPYEQVEVQSGDNFISRCYEWVMTQPDMAGAVAI